MHKEVSIHVSASVHMYGKPATRELIHSISSNFHLCIERHLCLTVQATHAKYFQILTQNDESF